MLYDDDDAFCVDGQRMVAVAGVHGRDGAEYRTRRDSRMKLVAISTSAPDIDGFHGFTVDGRILVYELTGNSRTAGLNGRTRTWALSAIKDRFGNAMDIEYLNDGHEVLPRRMTYARHDGTGGVPPLAATREVFFEYQVDNQGKQGFDGGVSRVQSRLLSKISVRQSGQTAWRYDLGYRSSADTDRPLLEAVTHCAVVSGSDRCRAPTTFSWYGTGSTFGRTNLLPAVSETECFEAVAADVDGDGRDDRICVDEWGQHLSVTLRGADGTYTHRDADVDFPPEGRVAGGCTTLCMAVTADGYGFVPREERKRMIVPIHNDADGRIDLAFMNASRWGVMRSDGGGSFTVTATSLPRSREGVERFADLNGDGYTDFVGCYDTIVFALNNHGTGFSSLVDTGVKCRGNFRLLDFDNDGTTDIVGWDGSRSFAISFRGAVPFGGTQGVHVTTLAVPGGVFGAAKVIDVNGDGYPDLVAPIHRVSDSAIARASVPRFIKTLGHSRRLPGVTSATAASTRRAASSSRRMSGCGWVLARTSPEEPTASRFRATRPRP